MKSVNCIQYIYGPALAISPARPHFVRESDIIASRSVCSSRPRGNVEWRLRMGLAAVGAAASPSPRPGTIWMVIFPHIDTCSLVASIYGSSSQNWSRYERVEISRQPWAPASEDTSCSSVLAYTSLPPLPALHLAPSSPIRHGGESDEGCSDFWALVPASGGVVYQERPCSPVGHCVPRHLRRYDNLARQVGTSASPVSVAGVVAGWDRGGSPGSPGSDPGDASATNFRSAVHIIGWSA